MWMDIFLHFLATVYTFPCVVFIAALMSSTFLFFYRCPVFRRLKEEAERRKRPSWNEIKGRKGDGETPGDAKHSSLSRNPTKEAPEPGMINPAFEENEDGMRLLVLLIIVSLPI